MLEVRNLETAYGDSQVLFGMELSVEVGQAVTLMGRNGMGKTTTIRSIMGLTPARSGSITFEGAEIRGLSDYKIAQLGLGLVPEGRQIFPNLTVRENLVATAANRSDAKAPWSVDKVFSMFPALAERARNMGNQLSGGEQQRVSVARAIINRPALLLADEPTGNLDSGNSDVVLKILQDLNVQYNQTIIMITHNPDAAATANRTCLLYTSPSPRDATLSRMPSSA